MSTMARPEKAVLSPPDRHRPLMLAAVGMSAIVGVLYAILFFIVRGVEADPAATEDSTYGAYLFLTIAYLVSTVAYAVLDRRAVWLAGAVLQVVVLGLFVVFGIGLLGPGVFDYKALVESTPVALWAGVITVLQLLLLGVLGYLATLKPSGRHAA